MSGPVLAQAVYENLAESSDELGFHVGDIVTVLEFDTDGLDGWWLCALNDNEGIAPGNRLRLLSHGQEDDVYDTPSNNSTRRLPWAEDDEYDVPTHSYNTSINANNNNNDSSEVYDVPTTRKNWVSPIANVSNISYTSSINPEEVYDIPPRHDVQNSTINSAANEEDIYDVPTNKSALDVSNFSTIDMDDVYDVPPRATPAKFPQDDDEDEEYDIPVSNKLVESMVQNTSGWSEGAFHMISVQDSVIDDDDDDVVYDVPSSRLAVDVSPGNTIVNNSYVDNNQSMQNNVDEDDFVYDVPLSQHDKEPKLRRQDSLSSLEKMMNRLSTVNDRKSDSSIDSCTSSIVTKALQFDEILLDATVASEMLIKKNQQVEDSVSHLLTLVYEGWRTRENLLAKLKDIKQTFDSVLIAVKEFLDFARACFANGNNAKSRTPNNTQPKHLVSGLYKLLMPIEEDYGMLERAKLALDQMNWDVNEMLKTQDKPAGIPDDTDSFIMTSRAVSDDASQMALYIHTHMQYLFSNNPDLIVSKPQSPSNKLNQSRPLPDVPKITPTKNNKKKEDPVITESWLEDYDYVSLEETSEINASIHESPGNHHHGHDPKIVDDKCKKILERLEHTNHSSGLPSVRISIENNHVSQNYINEMVNDVPVIVDALHAAVKKFYRSVEQRDPPKVFVAYSKQVVLCAHELVFFGDMLYKFLPSGSMQEHVKGHCAELCSALKQSVTSTKLAALNWPAQLNIKDLVSKITNITYQSHQFRIFLSQCTVR